MKTTARTHQAQLSTPQPKAVLTGAELAIVTALLGGAGKSVADVGIKGTEALIAFFRKEGPMAYRVLASWKEGNDYCVGLEFMNTTLHGGYVERIDVKKPTANFDFKVAKAKRVGKGFGLDEKEEPETANKAQRPLSWLKHDELLPLYVSPAGAAVVLLRFKDDVAGTLAKTQVLTLSYQLSIVGGDYADTPPQKKPKEVNVRLRGKGPYYLE